MLAQGKISSKDLAEDVETKLSQTVSHLIENYSKDVDKTVLTDSLSRSSQTVIINQNPKANKALEEASESVWAEEDDDEDEDEEADDFISDSEEENEPEEGVKSSTSQQFHLYDSQQKLVGVANFEQLHVMATNGSLYKGIASVWDKTRGTHLRVKDFAAAHHLPSPKNLKQEKTNTQPKVLNLLLIFFLVLTAGGAFFLQQIDIGFKSLKLKEKEESRMFDSQNEDKSSFFSDNMELSDLYKAKRPPRKNVRARKTRPKLPTKQKLKKKEKKNSEAITDSFKVKKAPLPVKPKVFSKISELRAYEGKKLFLGPLSFSKAKLEACKVRCQLDFFDQQGRSLKVVFFTAAYAQKLAGRYKRVFIEGRVAEKGKSFYLSKVLAKDP